MGADAVPIAVMTGGGCSDAKGQNKGVIQVVLVITATSCWLFWMLAYMHQMNPLIGPQLHNTTIIAIQYIWDETLKLPARE
ncbi:V-type proton ATPase subunit e-like [Eriocheir sinensis]|uniref:V-type proton ATPase subunit e-like n=1 Tax=Eriocheir sinensis TaxID=95602 RepID=UPI0021C59B7D|nr:V-type proton ATPase subunit e-like [Eriocheir sinensis]